MSTHPLPKIFLAVALACGVALPLVAGCGGGSHHCDSDCIDLGTHDASATPDLAPDLAEPADASDVD